MTGNPPSYTLAEIEAITKNYAMSRELLSSRVKQAQDRMEQVLKDADPLIRSALKTAKAAEAELQAAIVTSKALFNRPKTHVFHGVKVGFEKGKGKMTIADAPKTIELIRELFDKAKQKLLIKVKETPVKKALAQLTVAELKSIGVDTEGAGDQVVVRPVDSELDKALAALLKTEVVKAEGDDDQDDDAY